MKKGWMAALLLALLALAGAGAYFVRRPAAVTLPQTAEKPVLLSRDEGEIAAVRVEPPAGEGYTLERNGGDTRMRERSGMPLREKPVEEIFSVASALEAEEALADTGKEDLRLADFGLDPPIARAVIQYTDGQTAELLIGEETPSETPQRYCMMAGDPVIYTVLSVHTDVFFDELDALRDFTQPAFQSDLLDRVEISGDITFSMYYTASGWQMDAPYRYPLSRRRIENYLSRIESMAFESCLGGEEEMDLAQYGLDHPALIVTLTQAASVITGETQDGEQASIPVPETRYTLLLGSETGKSGVYLLWDHAVYKASNFLLGFWKETDVRSLLLREPVNLLVNDLDSVTFLSGDGAAAYHVRMVESITENNQIAVDEYGNTLYDAAVRREGENEDMDAAAFLNWYQQWAALAPAGELPSGYTPSGDASCSLILKNQSLTRRLDFYPYDALHSAMAVDGVCIYYVSDSALNALKQTP